ncbi:MAG TPA: FAD-dependent monooxygenase [Anaerolineaceae bacterium]
MEIKRNQVLVIGAGIGGLSAAIALRQIGYEVAVYDQASALTEIGAGLTLWANAIKALRKLGIQETALGGQRITRSDLLDWHGQPLYSVDFSQLENEFGAPSIALHRADLQRILLAQLPPGTLQLGMTCTGYRQDTTGVEAQFSNGSTVPGDLLIAADGIGSTIRKQMQPRVQQRYSGYIAWRGVVTYTDPVAQQRVSEAWGCGSRFGVVPIGNGKIYWFATANHPAGQKPSPADRKEELSQRFSGWHTPVEALIAATPQEQILYNDIVDFEPLSSFTDGRVVLLGDAAHATTPNMGQGACQALESSVVLARSLKEEASFQAALQRYERERMPRTSWITNQSWQLGRYGQMEGGFQCSVRDFTIRHLPASTVMDPIRKAVGFSV